MLLWHDCLDYATTTQLGGFYPATPGFFAGGAHPSSGRSSIQGQSGQVILPVGPASSAAGTETCIVGFRCEVGAIPYTAPFLEVQYASGPQVRVQIQPATGGVRFTFETGASSYLLLVTSTIDLSTPHYLEFVVKAGSLNNGSVSFRIDGIEDCRADFVNTAGVSTLAGWSRVILFANAPVINGFIRFSDLYLADGYVDASGPTFAAPLGPVSGRRLFPVVDRPDRSALEWVPLYSDGSAPPYDLVILAGQSNMNGRGFLPHPSGTPPWRRTNPNVPIWTRPPGGGPNYFAPIEAGVNTWGFFRPPGETLPVFWGPEMRFAERLAAFYESASDTAPPVRILKLAQDASSLAYYPGSPDLSWSSAQAGSLWFGMLTAIDESVAALGGWSTIRQVCFHWYQGETEALFAEGPPLYAQFLTNFFAELNAHYASSFPRGFDFTRVRIHKDILPSAFRYAEGIRNAQSSPSIPGTVVSIDEASMLNDQIHLDPRGLDLLGDILFDDWKAKRDEASTLKDYYYLNMQDDNGIRTSTAGSLNQMIQVGELQYGLNNGPCLSMLSRAHFKSDGALGLQVGMSFKPITIPVSAQSSWAPGWGISAGYALPEDVARSLFVMRAL